MPVGLIPPGRTGSKAASVQCAFGADEGKPLYLESARGLPVVGGGRSWQWRRVLRDELSGVIMPLNHVTYESAWHGARLPGRPTARRCCVRAVSCSSIVVVERDKTWPRRR